MRFQEGQMARLFLIGAALIAISFSDHASARDCFMPAEASDEFTITVYSAAKYNSLLESAYAVSGGEVAELAGNGDGKHIYVAWDAWFDSYKEIGSDPESEIPLPDAFYAGLIPISPLSFMGCTPPKKAQCKVKCKKECERHAHPKICETSCNVNCQ